MFNLWLSFYEPHSPFDFPVEYAGMFDAKKMPVGKVGADDDRQIPKVFSDLTPEEKQGIVAAYHTSVAYLDKNVGLVLDALRRFNLDENTLVIYVGDHGYNLGHHGRFEKHSFWEPAVRAPLIVSYPQRFKGGRAVNGLVEFIDLAPTILDVCGVRHPEGLQGRSLTPLLAGKTGKGRDYVFSEYLFGWEEAMIRTDEWKLISLTPSEHALVVETTVEIVNGRAPVIAGAGFNRMMAIEAAKQAAGAGADAILALPPYYPQADDEGLMEYYRAIGDATQLGLLIYSRDWANFSPAMVERLAASIPTLIGWKDGQGDVRRYQMIINRVGDRLYWIGGAGDDMVPGYYSIGIRTYTSSIATVAPKLSLMLHDAAANGRSDELARLMSDYVIPLYALRARRKGYEVSAMKAMMDMVGLRGGPVRPPLPDVRAEEREELRTMLEKWKPFLTDQDSAATAAIRALI